MSESPQQDKNTPTDQGYAYHWNYGEQTAFEHAQAANRSRRGVLTYAFSLIAVFWACILLLTCVLIWYQSGNVPTASGMTTGEVAERMNVSTVLILAKQGSTTGFGTGFFICSDGYIATNDHVVADCDSITVRLYSGVELPARYVGGSAPDDLAVIKIEGENYPAVTVGDSNSVGVGDVAIAVGHPGGEDAPWSTTQGIISATNRIVSVIENGYTAEVKMLQTDAALNPGNSGGALCNDRGEVIGVVARKLSEYEGLGFAIPINEAMQTLNALIDGSYQQANSTVSISRPTLGVTARNTTAGEELRFGNQLYPVECDGVLILNVESASCVYGILKPGDVVYEMDGVRIANLEALEKALYSYTVGDTAIFKIDRMDDLLEVTVQFGK